MSKTIYKVWIHIEEINEDEDYYEDVDEPWSLGEFGTLEEAKKLRSAISTVVGADNE